MSIYKYVFRSSGITWGIAVSIDCELFSISEYDDVDPNILAQVAPHLSIDTNVKVEYGDFTLGLIRVWKKYLIQGLRLVYDELMDKLGYQDTVVKITHLTTPIIDFQDEGLAYAIAGWFIENYDLPVTLPPPRFDGRYIFPFEEDE